MLFQKANVVLGHKLQTHIKLYKKLKELVRGDTYFKPQNEFLRPFTFAYILHFYTLFKNNAMEDLLLTQIS